MPLVDVLRALGFPKMASTADPGLRKARVDVTLRFSADELKGWGVFDAAIIDALGSKTTAESDQAAQFFDAITGTQWEVSFRGLGEPVDITRPPSALVLSSSDERCPS